MHWQVQSDYCDLLFGRDGFRLAEWLKAGLSQVVKHGSHRTVHRVVLPTLDIHVKHYRMHGLRAWLRDCVRPSKAQLEYDRSLAIAGRGIPSITPLALGIGGLVPGDSYLVTRTLEGVESLGTFLEKTLPTLPSPRQTRVRQRLAEALGRFMARVHLAGVYHPDLHAGNLLLHLDAGDAPFLYLIDLHAVRLGVPLAWPASRANLVILNRWFLLRASRSDRLRFWDAYYATRSSTEQACADPSWAVIAAERARDLEVRTWKSNLLFWARRDQRCLANNRHYRSVRSGIAAGYAISDLDDAVLSAFLADPDEPFLRPGVTLLKDSRSSTVAEFDLLVQGTARRVIYKRFRVTTRSDPLLALVRPSPALRSWVHGHGLRQRFLPTPRPLAVLHRCRCGLSYEGYLLTEKIAGAVELHRFVAELRALPPRQRCEVLRPLIDQMAHLARALHLRRLSHRDLKASNILVQWARGEGQSGCTGGSPSSQVSSLTPHTSPLAPRLWLIDLVGVSRHRRLSRSRRVQNLTRLHVSFHHGDTLTRTDRLRFLRTYLGWGLYGKQGWKEWWREIAQATQAKVVRNTRRGRPLA
jgi:tRNA A-37 threonylcarbamoyl transferase component Bud32